MTKEEAIKYLQQLYPNGGHCWLDEQRIEAISMAINALQEEPVSEKKCMFTNDNYTDEDRMILCEDCKEKCEYSKKEEPASEDLEEAAKLHVIETRCEDVVWDENARCAMLDFKAGAQWQKEKEYTCYEEAFEDGAKWKKEQIEKVLLSEVLPCFMHGGEADEVVAKLDEVLNQKK